MRPKHSASGVFTQCKCSVRFDGAQSYGTSPKLEPECRDIHLYGWNRKTMRKSQTIQHFVCLSVVLVAGGALTAAEVPVQAAGIPNFHQVNERLYRGAQPADSGWDSLAKLGVKVVIDLRRDGEEGHSIAAEAHAVQ